MPETEKPPVEKKKGEELQRMSFGDHLDELRRRLIKSVIALMVCFVGAMLFYEPLVKIVVQPHIWAMQKLEIPPDQWKFIAIDYVGPFFSTLKLAFIVGFFFASPIIAYQLWSFVSTGLYKAERKHVYAFAIPSFFLFVAGCCFGYFVMIPVALWGLSQIQVIDVVSPTYSFSTYLSLVMLLTIILGAVFELPLVMLFLTRTGLVQPSTFTKGRKIAIIIMFVFSAMLTPPDVFTQILMAGPLIVLYEIGVIMSKLGARERPKPEEA